MTLLNETWTLVTSDTSGWLFWIMVLGLGAGAGCITSISGSGTHIVTNDCDWVFVFASTADQSSSSLSTKLSDDTKDDCTGAGVVTAAADPPLVGPPRPLT